MTNNKKRLAALAAFALCAGQTFAWDKDQGYDRYDYRHLQREVERDLRDYDNSYPTRMLEWQEMRQLEQMRQQFETQDYDYRRGFDW